MHIIQRFLRKYKGRFFHLWCEEFFGWLSPVSAGLFGMMLRWGLYRLLFAELKPICPILVVVW